MFSFFCYNFIQFEAQIFGCMKLLEIIFKIEILFALQYFFFSYQNTVKERPFIILTDTCNGAYTFFKREKYRAQMATQSKFFEH